MEVTLGDKLTYSGHADARGEVLFRRKRNTGDWREIKFPESLLDILREEKGNIEDGTCKVRTEGYRINMTDFMGNKYVCLERVNTEGERVP